ncbi:MAG: long-chain acyl-CoA synthetase [Candidatus Krumholzibacteriia bacterium]|jgi:long-chain acyl-CoA synthetase
MSSANFNEALAGTFHKHWDVKCYTDLEGGTLTYGEVAQQILKLHHIFAEAGLRKGARVGIIGRNCGNWCISYLAAATFGAIAVPILPDFTSAEIEHIVRHSSCTFVFMADTIHERIDESKMESLQGVFLLNDFSLGWSANKELAPIVDNAEAGFRIQFQEAIAAQKLPVAAVDNADLMSIVYTSGTTGFSKGVMLNGASLISNIAFFRGQVDLEPGDQMVSFLPLAHVFGCTFDFLAPTVAGCHITYIEKIPTPKILLAAFQEYKPVVVLSVPLIIEKIYRNKIKAVLETTKVKMMLKVPGLNKLVHKKIYDEVYEVFGGNFKEMVVGGAAINKEIESFFREIGLRMTSGYGMTECGPLISYSISSDNPPAGSVGRVVDRMEVRIADPDPRTGVGEIQTSGVNRMMGYYNDKEATEEAIGPDGWLRTGDLGYLDDDGFLFLTGRSKNMILTSSGQNIYPEEIESQLNNLPCVEESLIIDNAGKLVALVYPNLESVDNACLKGRQVEDLMEENRKGLNKTLPRYCQIAKLKVLYEEFEKTPTKKIKRRFYNAFSG